MLVWRPRHDGIIILGYFAHWQGNNFVHRICHIIYRRPRHVYRRRRLVIILIEDLNTIGWLDWDAGRTRLAAAS